MQYKKVPEESLALLTLLKMIERKKPHSAYMIESLENTVLKLKMISLLKKRESRQEKQKQLASANKVNFNPTAHKF